MGVQTSYQFTTSRGIAGGLYDLSPYQINSRLNGPTMISYGTGVVVGNQPGSTVQAPTAESKASQYEGVLMTGHTTEMNLDGEIRALAGRTVGVLRYGCAWVRISKHARPAYGEAVYLVLTGEETGCFTTSEDSATKIAIHARFIAGQDGSTQIAPAEFYYQMHTDSANS